MNPNGETREELKGDRDRAIVENARRQIEAAKLEAENATRAPRSPMQSPDADAASGQLPDSFSGYDLVRQIHRGGQGVVYQAIQRTTKRKVAIKVLRDGPFAGPRDKARFEREVQILGQLSHPNIVGIHDSGVAAGNFFYVMDYISGQSLDVFMASRARSIDETLRLFAEICEAISAAHLRGVIHRDLKPGNIRIDQDGNPHILDFGLAKTVMGEATDGSHAQVMSMTGQFVGSAPWASPEQAEGIPGKIDIRTDVYSLGVILYQMLTARFPYEVVGNMREVLDNILSAVPIRPSTIRKQINNELETIVLRCLSKERERRYQSAGELARDIRHYLAGEPIEAKRDSGFYLLKKSLLRHRAQIVTGVAFLLVLLVVSTVFLWRAAKSDQQKADLESRRVLADAWNLARERVDLNGSLKKLNEIAPTQANSVDYYLVKAAVTSRLALEARIEEKAVLTNQAIGEFQNAHCAAGGVKFWDGTAVLNSFSGSQAVGSASALRAAAGLVMLNDWGTDTQQAKLADDACKLYSAAEQIENRMGRSAVAVWDPVPPAYDPSRDSLSKKRLRGESPVEAMQRADKNAEIVRQITSPVQSLVRGQKQSLESRYVTELLFDDLFVLNQELHWVNNENLVTNVFQNPVDEHQWTIDLNKNARWHDGSPLTAEDVEFSWNAFPCDAENRLESVTADGKYRVRIVHKDVRNTATQDMRIPVYPKHIWASLASPDKIAAFKMLDKGLPSKPIGNGPYLLESIGDSRVVLARWEEYYGRQPVMIHRITFEVDSSRSSRARKLAEGLVDTNEMKAEEYYWHVNGASFADHITKVRHDKYEYDFIYWNLRGSSLLAEPKIRKAIAHAVDLPTLRRFLYCDVYDQCLGIFQGQARADSHSAGDVGYDPRRAIELLTAAIANENKVRDSSSRIAGETQLRVNLLVPTENISPRLAARLLREQAYAIGIDIRLYERPYSDCSKAFEKGVEEVSGSSIVFHGFYSGVRQFGDPADDAERWQCNGKKNLGRYCNSDVDNQLEKAATAMESDKKGEYYRSVQRIVFDDQPYLFLWQKPSLWAFNDRLRGVKFSNMGPALFYPGARAWWVAAKSPN